MSKKPNPFDHLNRYIIQDFSSIPPFSSFLPGIAGLEGVPMWVFYSNRGQGVTSFGVENKDSSIMEFQPANKAYRDVATTGFRTFVKLERSTHEQVYEPFSPWNTKDSSRNMFIGMNEVELEEYNSTVGLQTNALYFTMPGENFAGLVRALTIQNINQEAVSLELLDGLPSLIPFGVNNVILKSMSRTAEAWMEVFNLEKCVPFYRVRASIGDEPEVETFKAGNFALAFISNQEEAQPLKPFVDPNIIFGNNTALTSPDDFYKYGLGSISRASQITLGKTPCAFFGVDTHLQPGESITIHSIYGHISDVSLLNKHHSEWLRAGYIKNKRSEANQLTDNLTEAIATHTSDPIFDGYCRQTYLDNLVRGGLPMLLGKKNTPYHIFSRKHGDPERDYNDFFLAAEFYSQGNGNYRDVNQNRRSDVFFNPEVGIHNIHTFMSLIQADGYNPLVVEGSQFTIDANSVRDLLNLVDPPEPIENILTQPFTPGKLMKAIVDHRINLETSPGDFLSRVIDKADQHIRASFGEGYWIDHWTYNLDLIESFLTIFPEQKSSLLFGRREIPFYDSPVIVNPRNQRYCLTTEGPRQLNAVSHDTEKENLIASRETSPNLMRAEHGLGEIYQTDLFTKLVILTLVKFTTMDPWGMGIEMEAGKPGWDDAMNGLPALFGSSMPETFELKRLLQFILDAIREQSEFDVMMPREVHDLMEKTTGYLKEYHRSDDPDRDHEYWDNINKAREAYRARIRMGFNGSESSLNSEVLVDMVEAFLDKVNTGIQRSLEMNNSVPPTFFTFDVVEFEEIANKDSVGDPNEITHFRARKFSPAVLPLFLEGPVRALKTLPHQAAINLYNQVKETELFDRKLKMYRVNASLEDQSHLIGRIRSFPPGWLENESIWLHMEYKYLLEVMKAGLYDEFYDDFRDAMVPFMDPSTYQRSPLENSSFLVSSAHPDETLHGAGFVARLSGSTAEFLSMWNIMMAGKQPFTFKEGELSLKLSPILPGWIFTDSGEVSFKFLGACTVTYHNPDKLDTFKEDIQPVKYILNVEGGKTQEIPGSILPAPYAEDIRAGRIPKLDVFLSDKRP